MRFLILLLVFISLSNAYAVDNPRLPIKTNDELSLHQQNNASIKDIKEKNKVLKESVVSHKNCTDQGMVYIGIGASGADVDGCYNLSRSINTATTMRPYFAGFLKRGVVSFQDADASYDSSIAGRFKIDLACHNDYPNSRALTYDDLKYLLPTLNLPENIDKNPIWVMDSAQGIHKSSTDFVFTKNGDKVGKMYDCEGWGTSEEFYSGTALMKETGVSPNYLKIIYNGCDSGGRIVCVYN